MSNLESNHTYGSKMARMWSMSADDMFMPNTNMPNAVDFRFTYCGRKSVKGMRGSEARPPSDVAQ